jgi:hypothetical protein
MFGRKRKEKRALEAWRRFVTEKTSTPDGWHALRAALAHDVAELLKRDDLPPEVRARYENARDELAQLGDATKR